MDLLRLAHSTNDILCFTRILILVVARQFCGIYTCTWLHGYLNIFNACALWICMNPLSKKIPHLFGLPSPSGPKQTTRNIAISSYLTPVITQIYITPKQHLNTSCLAQPTPLLTKNIRKHIHRWKENAPKSSNFYFCPPPKKKRRHRAFINNPLNKKRGAPWGT